MPDFKRNQQVMWASNAEDTNPEIVDQGTIIDVFEDEICVKWLSDGLLVWYNVTHPLTAHIKIGTVPA